MDLKKVVITAIACIILLILLLNSSILADQAVAWVTKNPKDPEAALVLFRAGRWCDTMGDNDRAQVIYWQLDEQYPERADLVAPALFYSADILANGSNILGLRKQANPILEIIMNQYSSQQEWSTKAKKLFDEVNYVR